MPSHSLFFCIFAEQKITVTSVFMKTIKKWKTLSTEYLIKRPWLTARRDAVQLPSGEINDEFYILEYPTWINVIAITEDNRYVMVEQYRHGIDKVSIELCAGVVEDGESPLDGARRELAEETGYTGGEWELTTVLSPNPSTQTNYTYCFTARGVKLTGEQHLDRTEDINVHLIDREELLRLLNEDKIKQALMAAPLWKHFFTETR